MNNQAPLLTKIQEDQFKDYLKKGTTNKKYLLFLLLE